MIAENKERKVVVSDVDSEARKNSVYDARYRVDDMMRLPRQQFAALGRLVMRDLNQSTSSPSFYLYDKDRVTEFLKDPYKNEKSLRNAVIYIYGASSHFRRLIQYFASLSDLAYVVSPCRIDTASANTKTVKRNYAKVMSLLSSLDIRTQFAKVLTVCLREDVFYGTMHIGSDSIIIQQLPSDCCAIAVIEDNVLNVSFDFSYFDKNASLLPMYPAEFSVRYDAYLKDRTNLRWQELDAPTSFAVKCNADVLNYATPPFAGILREIYDIEDYKQLKKAKTELENYAMLVMKLGINSDGEWEMDFEKAKEFWRNLDAVLPDEVGSVLSPMEIEKIGFEKTNTRDTDTIAEAEQNLYTAAGTSSLLFNNEKASANALTLSIKVDQALTFGIVKGIEGVLNRLIRRQAYGKNFKLTFLDVSPFNRKEMGDAYIKACQFGLPMISYYAASQGMMQDELDYMNFLEDSVLDLVERFKPLRSSSTMSSSEGDGAGRPLSDADTLSEEGERTREEA